MAGNTHTFHKATVGINSFVDDLSLSITMTVHAETNPHPDFHVEGARLAELLYDYLPGATVCALMDRLDDLSSTRPNHGVSGPRVSHG